LKPNKGEDKQEWGGLKLNKAEDDWIQTLWRRISIKQRISGLKLKRGEEDLKSNRKEKIWNQTLEMRTDSKH
jgi:hypothetical protein